MEDGYCGSRFIECGFMKGLGLLYVLSKGFLVGVLDFWMVFVFYLFIGCMV